MKWFDGGEQWNDTKWRGKQHSEREQWTREQWRVSEMAHKGKVKVKYKEGNQPFSILIIR